MAIPGTNTNCNNCQGADASGNPKPANGSLLDQLRCYGYAPRGITDADVTAYAQRSGAKGGDQLCMVRAQLLAGRLMYAKNVAGDCPQATKVNLGAPALLSKGVGLAGTAVGAAGAIGALGPLSALAGPLSIITIPLAIWSAISAHHKIAVAREQATICDVTGAYNSYEDTIEAGLVAGSISVTDAKAAIVSIEPQLMAALQAIVKGGCDAACYYKNALKALDLYATEKLYDSLTPRAATSGNNPANIAAGAALPQASVAAKYGLAAAGGFAAFKLAGVLI